MEKVNAYLLLEKHVIQLMNELAGLNTEDWFLHFSIKTENGKTIEFASRTMYVESDLNQK